MIGVLLDLSVDSWLYIMNNTLKLKVVDGEIGSSTMPHKVNPINFENAEANFGLSSNLFGHLALKLQSSRMQRDLSDSSTLRAAGTAFGHLCVAMNSLKTGLLKVEFNHEISLVELRDAHQLLAEPIQTVMRMYKIDNSYEKLKELTRGNSDSSSVKSKLDALLTELEGDVPSAVINGLRNLSPESYIGVAPEIADKVYIRWQCTDRD
eukprot:GHVH01005755.1.p1 GENE.GHVH01005755.1~~GHVH01005755.1.p1  ORF type:complete len:208 (+),score=40.65 GHVH01005755.1:815-1438(+)